MPFETFSDPEAFKRGSVSNARTDVRPAHWSADNEIREA